MGQRRINKGCGRPYHQFMGRKSKKAIQDILRSMERVLPRSQFYFDKCINLRRLGISTYALQIGLSYLAISTAVSMLSMILPACNGTEFG